MDRLLASLMFFTRLPLWRLRTVPSECFKKVVIYWSLAGWIIGGMMAAVYYLCTFFLSFELSWGVAIITRLLLTGAMHCDGLADFLDGFGGGTSRERILAIMKDSHIGTYGVIGLILYFILLWQVGTSLPPLSVVVLILCGNTWPRFISSQVINLLPYARKEEESKAKVVYDRMTVGEWCFALITGCVAIPLLPHEIMVALITPVVIAALLIWLMYRKIGGYTGDCCGALFTLTELSFYITVIAIWR